MVSFHDIFDIEFIVQISKVFLLVLFFGHTGSPRHSAIQHILVQGSTLIPTDEGIVFPKA